MVYIAIQSAHRTLCGSIYCNLGVTRVVLVILSTTVGRGVSALMCRAVLKQLVLFTNTSASYITQILFFLYFIIGQKNRWHPTTLFI